MISKNVKLIFKNLLAPQTWAECSSLNVDSSITCWHEDVECWPWGQWVV